MTSGHPRSNLGTRNNPASRPSSTSASQISHTNLNHTQVTHSTSKSRQYSSVFKSLAPPLSQMNGLCLVFGFCPLLQPHHSPSPYSFPKGWVLPPSTHVVLKPIPISRPTHDPCVPASILPREWPSPTAPKFWMQTVS